MPDQPILVTFAVPQESGDFRRALRGMECAGMIRVEHIGVGPKVAGESMTRLLATEKPLLVICTGFAGGLDSRLATDDLIVAENFSTPALVAQLRQRVSPKVAFSFGQVVSCAAPAELVAAKAALARETGALAVDMESEAVAAACRAVTVPLLVVRAISDPAHEPLPVPFGEWFDMPRQRPRVFGLLKYLAFHPGQIGPFTHFVRNLAPARRALAEFLVDFLASSNLPP